MEDNLELTISDVQIIIGAFLSGGFGLGLSIGLGVAIYFSVAPDNIIGWTAVITVLCASIFSLSLGTYWLFRMLKNNFSKAKSIEF
ncbi:hypothetical protein CAG54_10980 [Vibrio sp. V27_P1S3P104]|uniref:hypothetical protein n=1 Tax=unclassified Vibrio TaxID=2614977 RepID=UPI001372B770|nr:MULTISPECIES: hypothetical protein [unclassified Vibrio]NAX35501.1 hypothetical protein [Vibrio sp. V29_P1S30P107]NAX38021.1 hypothetical protein [Vibrio sp. V27_P1S3P104]